MQLGVMFTKLLPMIIDIHYLISISYWGFVMRNSYPQSINALFNDNTKPGCTPLSQIQQRIVMLLNLNRKVSLLLPPTLRPWCRVGNFFQNVIVIECANASWMIRLRREQAQLLSTLRIHILPSLSSIDIRINPILAIKGRPNTQKIGVRTYVSRSVAENPRVLSIQSAKFIGNVAARSEGKLQELLERLMGLAIDDSHLNYHKK